jgi:hypothetical protein
LADDHKGNGMPDLPEPHLPEPSGAHRRLDVFVGKWRHNGASYADGQRSDDPLASAVPWTGDESYEWLPGGFFLLHRWDAILGTREFKGTEILGYDEAEGVYFTRMFDNAGNHPDYRASVDGDVWTFSESATRATVTVTDRGNGMNVAWQWRKERSDWLPLCDRVATRVE